MGAAMDITELEEMTGRWVEWAKSIAEEIQHYDDYLNDLDIRSNLGTKVNGLKEGEAKQRIVRQLRMGDEFFLNATNSYPVGLSLIHI